MVSSFSARVVSGAGRGRAIGTPTLNLDLQDVPPLTHGIYACWARLDDSWEPAVLHIGPRPVFQDSVACEVHLIDQTVVTAPAMLNVAIRAYLRPVLSFPSVTDLQVQITRDIDSARAMLRRHAPPPLPQGSDS